MKSFAFALLTVSVLGQADADADFTTLDTTDFTTVDATDFGTDATDFGTDADVVSVEDFEADMMVKQAKALEIVANIVDLLCHDVQNMEGDMDEVANMMVDPTEFTEEDAIAMAKAMAEA